MLTLIIILQAITLALVAYAARKAMWAGRIAAQTNELVRSSSVRTTQQLEALDALYARLELERGSLPPTRGWAASPDFLNILYDQIIQAQPEWMVECGSGLTSIVTARALQKLGRGRLVSLEHDETFAKATGHTLETLGLAAHVEIHVTPLVKQTIGGSEWLWYDLASIELPQRLDMIVVDGPPMPIVGEEGRYPAGPMLFPRLGPGGIVLLDDVVRSGERRIVDRFLREDSSLHREDLVAEKGCVKLART